MAISLSSVHRADARELIGTIRKGLSPDQIAYLQDVVGLSSHELVNLTGLSRSTLSRRRSTGTRLAPGITASVLRIARVFSRASEVLGTPERAREWLRSSVYGLDGQRPIDLLDTEPGAQWVERVLHQIDYGLTA